MFIMELNFWETVILHQGMEHYHPGEMKLQITRKLLMGCRCSHQFLNIVSLFAVLHWNKNVILTKFSSLAALEVVILTTSSATSDENFIKMKIFPFQCKWNTYRITGPLWGKSTGHLMYFPWKVPVMWSFYVFYVVTLNNMLNSLVAGDLRQSCVVFAGKKSWCKHGYPIWNMVFAGLR